MTAEFNLDKAFPIWTEVVNTSAGSGANGSSGRARGDTSLASLSDILGWRINKGDAQGIRRALDDAFSITRAQDGHAVVTWKQRGFRVQAGSSGIAEITGAQRSIYDRTRAIVDQIYPLLDGLLPLTSDPDWEDIHAIQSLIRPELEELVEQFGTEGGPVPERVDNALFLLIAYTQADESTFADPAAVEGQLGLLRDLLGFTGKEVNTVGEELRLTNFQTLVNYVDMLRLTWHLQRGAFERVNDISFLGTQTVLIERALGCVAESVQEVYRAMDSVFLGPLERSAITLSYDLNRKKVTVTVAELLEWIDDIATTRAFDIIREGGKEGIIHALKPTLIKVDELLGGAIHFITEEDPPLPKGMFTSRVGATLQELQIHLHSARTLSEAIHRDETPAIIDMQARENQNISVDIKQNTASQLALRGRNFNRAAKIELCQIETRTTGKRTAGRPTVRRHTIFPKIVWQDDDEITAIIPALETSNWNVFVVNPDGRSSNVGTLTIK